MNDFFDYMIFTRIFFAHIGFVKPKKIPRLKYARLPSLVKVIVTLLESLVFYSKYENHNKLI